jgi:hypothetical protein
MIVMVVKVGRNEKKKKQHPPIETQRGEDIGR